MTPRTEITPEMVERAFKVYGARCGWTAPDDGLEAHKRLLKKALEAALSPEPEIAVSEGMRKAAAALFDECFHYERVIDSYAVAKNRDAIALTIYRAMRKKEMEEQGATRAAVDWHRRFTDEYRFKVAHRRRDDR